MRNVKNNSHTLLWSEPYDYYCLSLAKIEFVWVMVFISDYKMIICASMVNSNYIKACTQLQSHFTNAQAFHENKKIISSNILIAEKQS